VIGLDRRLFERFRRPPGRDIEVPLYVVVRRASERDRGNSAQHRTEDAAEDDGAGERHGDSSKCGHHEGSGYHAFKTEHGTVFAKRTQLRLRHAFKKRSLSITDVKERGVAAQ